MTIETSLCSIEYTPDAIRVLRLIRRATTYSVSQHAASARGRRRAEAADDRTDDRGEVAVVHAQRVGMGARVEHHLWLTDEASFHEHRVSVHRAERRHRADFEFGVERGNLVFVREAQRDGSRQVPERVEIDRVVRRHDCLHRLPVGNADDDLRRLASGDVSDR